MMKKEDLLSKLVVRSCDMRVEPNSALQIFSLVKKAFENLEQSDHREQFLVEKLYNSPDEGTYIPELSLIAELGEEIVGFALFTKCLLVPPMKTILQNQPSSPTESNNNNNTTASSSSSLEPIVSLCLAPLAIKPQYQKMGIGSMLMKEAHKRARELGFTSVVLVGHEHYYPRFGYRMMKEFGICVPYEGIPDQYCQVVELVEGCLTLDARVKGSMVEYAKEFSNY